MSTEGGEVGGCVIWGGGGELRCGAMSTEGGEVGGFIIWVGGGVDGCSSMSKEGGEVGGCVHTPPLLLSHLPSQPPCPPFHPLSQRG